MVWRLAGGKGHRRSPGAAVRTADGAGPRDTSVAALPSPTKCLSPELDSFCISCRVWSFLAASAPGAACSCSICKCLQGEGGRGEKGPSQQFLFLNVFFLLLLLSLLLFVLFFDFFFF